MKNNRIEVYCAHCSNSFQAHPYRIKNGTAKYCGRDCYLAARWKRTASCERCGKECQHRYCSDDCRRDHWNANGFRAHKHPRNWQRKMALIESLGGACVKCGEPDFRVLDIDHIDRAGKTGRPASWNCRFKDWAANAGNLRLLCANCHRVHTWEQMGYGPHATPPNNRD